MVKVRHVVSLVLLSVASVSLLAQAPPTEVSFDVVSIKRHIATAGPQFGSNVTQRPDGGFTMVNIPLGTLISRAYPPAVPIDMVGLPDWVMRERYDVSATSTLSRPTSRPTDCYVAGDVGGPVQARRAHGDPRTAGLRSCHRSQ